MSNTWGCASTVATPTTVALDENTSFEVSTTIVVEDWPVFVGWQSSDLNLFTPASAPILARTTDTASPSRSSAASKTGAPTPSRTPAPGAHTGTKVPISSRVSTPAGGSNTGTGRAGGTSIAESDSSNNTPGKLTLGAEIGIAVGVAVAIIAIAAMAFWLVRRKRQRIYSAKSPSQTNVDKQSVGSNGIPVYERHEAPPSPRRAELPTGWHGHEM